MKIGEVKVGTEYAVLDRSMRRHTGKPRRVLALSIETVEEKVYVNLTNEFKPTKARRVKIRLLDEPQRQYGGTLESGAKGSETLVEARDLPAPWAKLAPGIRDEAEQKEFEEQERTALAARLKALGVRGIGKNDYYSMAVRVGRRKRAGGFHVNHELRLEGKALEKLLALAETGKAAEAES